jgi:hypothetical protein
MRGANLAGQVDRVIAEVERFREALEGKRAILGCLDLWTDLGGADRVRLSQAPGGPRGLVRIMLRLSRGVGRGRPLARDADAVLSG